MAGTRRVRPAEPEPAAAAPVKAGKSSRSSGSDGPGALNPTALLAAGAVAAVGVLAHMATAGSESAPLLPGPRGLDLGITALAAAGLYVWLRHVLNRHEQRMKRARDELSQGRVHRLLFERSDEGLFVCRASGRILDCNPAAERQLGCEASAIVGTRITEWVQPASPPAAPGNGFAIAAGELNVQPRGGRAAFAAQAEVHELHQDGSTRFVVGLRDLTEDRKTRQQLQYLANYDNLTGLPNRALFRERLGRAMERASRYNRPMALFFLDLDRFKVVNDSLGHEAGDRLLQHVSTVLTQCLRPGDAISRGTPSAEACTISRLGGDEFTVIIEDVGSAEDAAIIAKRLLDALTAPFKVGDEEIHVSASIGISLFPTDDVDLDGIIRHTDMAMYRSKALGRNTYSFFSDDLNAAVSARLSLEGSLRRAIEREEFCLHYMPKADLKTGQITGVEALLRWHCPGRGMVPPDRFIAVLEDTGLIVQAGSWAIRRACVQLAEWDRMGLPPISMAVNLSARQLRHPFLVALVQDTLRETGISPTRLQLELTESLLMEDTEGNRAVLAAFKGMGLSLAIDDFGTGHSSLSYLRRLDVDTLKIDRSFVAQIPHDAEDCAIAKAVVALGQSLQMKVVAEGVETEAQMNFLRELGCNDMQGWYLSRALPSEELVPWLRERHREHLARTNPQRYVVAEVDLPEIRIPEASTTTRRTKAKAARVTTTVGSR